MTATPTAWDAAPLPDLIRYLVSHYHDRLRAEFPELIAMAERVEARHPDTPGCPRGLQAILESMHATVLEHLAKEERVLFPLILEGVGRRASGPVRVMEMEHEEHRRNLARIRELTGDFTPPAAACPSWQSLYHRLAELESELLSHMHLENHVLFPRALSED